MAKKENENDKGPVVSVDGTEMYVRDLNENQRYIYHQIEDLSRKQFTAQSELDQINGSLVYFKNLFINSTKEQADEVLQESENEVDAKVS
tara:strand:- start:1382 stop:1651 length:270 start_codon:yes stop_codon:yes gene_type:complete